MASIAPAGAEGNRPPPSLELIPEALTAHRNRWGTWTAGPGPKPGKVAKKPTVPTKVPWRDFKSAAGAYIAAPDRLAGIGFLMTIDEAMGLAPHGIVALDIDNVIDDNGELAQWANEIVHRCGTYVEHSPSGRGFRVFGYGSIGSDWTNHDIGIEVYAGHTARYLTVTGNRVDGGADDLQSFPNGFLEDLEAQHRKNPGDRQAPPVIGMPPLLADDELPALDELGLPAKAYEFLTDGEHGGDRSRSLAGATIALYNATSIDGKLRDDIVLSLLRSNPHAWQVAMNHRGGDEDRALAFLWMHQCVPGRAKASPIPDAPMLDASGTATARKSALVGPGAAIFSHDELTGQPYAPRSIVDHYLLEDAGGLVAPGGVGKTTLAIWEAIHIILGKDFYGFAVKRPGPVLFITAEDSRAVIGGRLNQIMREMDLRDREIADVRQGFFCEDISGSIARLVQAQSSGSPRRTGFADEIITKYRDTGIVLIHLDPTSLIGPGESSANDGMAELMRTSRYLSAQLRAAVRLVHHVSKEVARNSTTDQYAGRGGAAFADNSRYQHQLVVLTQRKLAFEGVEFRAPPEITDQAILDGKVLALLIHKFSYGERVKRPIWIWREGFRYQTFTSHPVTRDEARRSEFAGNVRRLVEFIVGRGLEMGKGGRPVRITRSLLDGQCAELGLRRIELRTTLEEAIARGLVVEKELPRDEQQGRRKTYLAAADGVVTDSTDGMLAENCKLNGADLADLADDSEFDPSAGTANGAAL